MKILLVGGSKGLGKELLCQLTRHTDNHVVYVCRTHSELVEIRDSLEWMELDLNWGSPDIAHVVKKAATRLGGIDALIVSSGHGAYHPVLVSDATIQKMFQTNVFGPWAVYREALKYLLKSRGKAIFVTSIADRKPGCGGLSWYAGSKGAVNSWVISESRRAASKGVALCAVSPGFFDSEMTEDMKPEEKEKSTKAIPYGRFGGVGEIAMFVKGLLDQSNWAVAGSIYELSGGA